jgi:hypothetical protein
VEDDVGRIGQRLVRSLALGVTSVLLAVPGSAETPKWDRIANIKEMAVHIGTVQRDQGAVRALAFIDACYRTHGLGSAYSKSFEGCIAADYMLAQALVAVASRVPTEDLRQGGSAEPAEIITAVQSRIGSGFGQYGIGAADAKAILVLVEQHGMTAFLQTVFPKAASKSKE